jgi:hypothetical protein
MIGPGATTRVPLPTRDALIEAMELGREIIACSGAGSAPLIGMNIAFRNGDTSIVLVDALAARHLLAALKAMFPSCAEIPASRGIGGDVANGVQEG